MTLNDYFEKIKRETGKPLSDAAFAERIKVHQSQVSRLRNGRSKPSFETIAAVFDATDGCVTPNDWFDVAEAAE